MLINKIIYKPNVFKISSLSKKNEYGTSSSTSWLLFKWKNDAFNWNRHKNQMKNKQTEDINAWQIFSKPNLSTFKGKSMGAPRHSPLSLLNWHNIRPLLIFKLSRFFRLNILKNLISLNNFCLYITFTLTHTHIYFWFVLNFFSFEPDMFMCVLFII